MESLARDHPHCYLKFVDKRRLKADQEGSSPKKAKLCSASAIESASPSKDKAEHLFLDICIICSKKKKKNKYWPIGGVDAHPTFMLNYHRDKMIIIVKVKQKCKDRCRCEKAVKGGQGPELIVLSRRQRDTLVKVSDTMTFALLYCVV